MRLLAIAMALVALLAGQAEASDKNGTARRAPATSPSTGSTEVKSVRISDGGEVMSTYTIRDEAMSLTDPKGYSRSRIIALAHEDNWPSDISAFKQRMDYKERTGVHPLTGLAGYQVGTVNDYPLVLIPKAENGNARFTVSSDFFVVIKETGIEARAKPKAGVVLPKVRISNGGEVMSTYKIGNAELSLLDPKSFPRAQVISLAHEDQWPPEISTFKQRMALESEAGVHPMQGLVGYQVGTVDGHPLLLIPKAENGNARFAVTTDFFVAIKQGGVSPR